MKLPVPAIQKYETILPSTGEKIEFRSYLVKEEKTLLLAAESKKSSAIQNALKNLLRSCILTDNIEVEKLPAFDIDWMFLQTRMKSVGETTEIEFTYKDCPTIESGCVKSLEVNLEDVKFIKNDNHKTKIQLDDNLWVEMGYPNMEILDRIEKNNKKDISEGAKFFKIIYSVVKKVYTEEDVWTSGSDFSLDDVEEFIGGLDGKQMKKIYNFMNTIPTLKYSTKLKCLEPDCNHVINKEFTNIIDFFI